MSWVPAPSSFPPIALKTLSPSLPSHDHGVRACSLSPSPPQSKDTFAKFSLLFHRNSLSFSLFFDLYVVRLYISDSLLSLLSSLLNSLRRSNDLIPSQLATSYRRVLICHPSPLLRNIPVPISLIQLPLLVCVFHRPHKIACSMCFSSSFHNLGSVSSQPALFMPRLILYPRPSVEDFFFQKSLSPRKDVSAPFLLTCGTADRTLMFSIR